MVLVEAHMVSVVLRGIFGGRHVGWTIDSASNKAKERERGS